jgi:hypothetical protein
LHDERSSGVRRRLFWFGLLVAHWGAIPSLAGGSIARGAIDAEWLFRAAGLLASLGFFVLKILDVPWLRVRPGWRAAISAAVVVLLLHVGVVERFARGEFTYSPASFGAVLSAGSVWESAELRRTWRVLRDSLFRRLSAAVVFTPPAVFRWTAWAWIESPPALSHRPGVRSPRAPPLPF